MTILEKQPAQLVNENIDQVGRHFGSPDLTTWLVCSWLTRKDEKINYFLCVLSGQPYKLYRVNIHKNQDRCSKFERVLLYGKGDNFETINTHNVIMIIIIHFGYKNLHATENNRKLMHIIIKSSEIHLDTVVLLKRVFNWKTKYCQSASAMI